MKIYVGSHGVISEGGSALCVSTDKQKVIDCLFSHIYSQGENWHKDEEIEDVWWNKDEIFYIQIQEFDSL